MVFVFHHLLANVNKQINSSFIIIFIISKNKMEGLQGLKNLFFIHFYFKLNPTKNKDSLEVIVHNLIVLV
jgi:hypothetical protein